MKLALLVVLSMLSGIGDRLPQALTPFEELIADQPPEIRKYKGQYPRMWKITMETGETCYLTYLDPGPEKEPIFDVRCVWPPTSMAPAPSDKFMPPKVPRLYQGRRET